MTMPETVMPPLGAWSSILREPHVEPVEHANPEVRLWSVTDGRHSFLVRAFGPWRPGAGLADEYRVLLHLRRAGLPVALPVVTDAASLFAQEGDASYLLIPRLPAEDGDAELRADAAEVCSHIGAAIGSMHRALAEYPWPVASYEHDLRRQTLEEAGPKLPPDVRSRWVDRHLATVEDRLTGLGMQLIHGDCNSGNILVHQGRVSGIIDLDHLPRGQRIYDLAYYLAHRVRAAIARPEDDFTSALFSSIGGYVTGYDAVNPLSEKEHAALPVAVLAAEISLTSWSHVLLTELTYRAGPGEAEHYAHGVRSLRLISENFERLTAALNVK
jgi:Ser/Thr protein kinase RdoA (MazF antagonist)